MTREELRDYIEEQRSLNMIPYHVYSALIDGIDTLEQEPKIGHWIPLGNYDDYGNENSYKCSECGDIDIYPDNFCSNCGARMIKPQGSIEKESIPYLMHKEMGVPISECQKAYDIGMEYLRSQGKLKG